MRWIVALVVLIELGSTSAVAADWVRIDTPNFVVYGEAGEKRTREVASQFERFREALGRILPGAATRAAVPTVVVVFNTARSFEPYRPIFNGKRVEVAGYFRASEFENIVALTIDSRVDAMRVIFHEYTHLAIANIAPELPPWVSEGLAEFYSTYLVSDDGRRATLGIPIPSHVQLLGTSPAIPLADLLAVTHASPLYNEGQRRSMFYAESWALVHYLMLEEPTRGANLSRYLRLVAAGTDAVAAWTQVFGAGDLVPAIRRYAGRAQLRGLIYRFSTGIDTAGGTAARVMPSEIEAVFGDLLQSTAAPSLEAEVRLERALKLQPASGRAQALIGLARASRPDSGDPIAPLVAASSDPDWLTQYYVAAGLTPHIDDTSGDERTRLVAAATRALDAVQAVRPDLPHAFKLRAEVAIRGDGDLEAALSNIRRARAGAPGRDDYAFLEAQILARLNRFAEARDVMGPLMSPAAAPATREHALAVMRLIVMTERQAAEQAERRAMRTTRPLDPLPAPPPPAPAARPVYRAMRHGEQRTEGLLERIECGAHSVTLHLRADGHLLRFTAPRMGDVDFIEYRQEVSGEANLRPTHAARSRVRHLDDACQPPAGTLGRAVAVEFLGQVAHGRQAPACRSRPGLFDRAWAPGCATASRRPLRYTARPVIFPARYRLDREIGRGGMAVVYLAHDQHLGRQVAIKVLSADLSSAVDAERFGREISVLARLVHPNIVALFDSGETDGRIYYVMPFVAGDTLRARLLAEGRIAPREIAALGADVAEALAYAHGAGVVHRDVKPENIFTSGGRAILGDFGIAQVSADYSADAVTSSLTTRGLVLGTLAYISPEQASGEGPIDGRSDLYSLGCVLYEAVAGVLRVQSIVEKILAHTDAAVVFARKAVALAPDVATFWNALGDVLLAAGRNAEAVDALKRAIALTSGYLPALERLELAYVRLGDAQTAIDLRLSRLRIGGQVARAESIERDTLDSGPEAARRADVRRDLETLLNAAGAADPFAEYFSSRNAADRIVIAYAELGEWHKAMDWVERAYARHPGRLRRMLTDHPYDHRGLAVDPRYARLLRVAGLEELL